MNLADMVAFLQALSDRDEVRALKDRYESGDSHSLILCATRLQRFNARGSPRRKELLFAFFG